MGASLTDSLWGSIEDTYKAILDHPFIDGLTTGSLERDAFRFYVVQDALYLQSYSRALAVCGAKAPHEEAVKMFCEHAAGAVDVERQLHEGFFREFGMSDGEVHSTQMAPTTLAYTSYLLAAVYGGSFAEALGAVLPCYWIYWEVGKALVAKGSPDPLYTRWIETYGGEEFAGIVQAALSVTDEIGADLSRAEEMKMNRHFTTTTRYEWMFWEMGYRKERWPV